MVKPRGFEPYKKRHNRFKVLVTLLYNRSLNRPTPDTVVTSPTELGKCSGISKNHHTIDALKWMEDFGYIENVECRYGHVSLRIKVELLTAGPPVVGSPSDSALGGGLVIPAPSEPEVEVKYYRSGVNPKIGLKLPITYPKEVIEMDGDVEITYKEYEELMEAQIAEGEEACQEKQQEKEVEDQPMSSEGSSTSSTNLPKRKFKRKLPSTTE